MSNVLKFCDADNVEQYYHFVMEEDNFGWDDCIQIPNEAAPGRPPTLLYNNDDFIKNQVHNARLEGSLKLGYLNTAQEPALNIHHPDYYNYPQQPKQQYQTNFAQVKSEDKQKKEDEESINRMREYIRNKRRMLTANEVQQSTKVTSAHAQNTNNQWNATGTSANAQSRAGDISWYDEVENEKNGNATSADSFSSCNEWEEADREYQQPQNQRNGRYSRAPRAAEEQRATNGYRSSSDSEEKRQTSFSGRNSASSSFELCSEASYVNDAKPLYRKHQLLGDSQFVRFARQILGVKVVKNSISYCVSGQKIQGLYQMLLYSEFRLHDRVILMIGTNDLRNNFSLARMKESYKKLLDFLKESCKKIVLVTLPPIQCMIDSVQHWRTLEGFNKFILEQHNGKQVFVVDLARHLVEYGGSSSCRKYYEECYASNPKRKDLMHLNKKGFLLLKSLLDVHYFH